MLLVFSGTYGVGKSHFMSFLSKEYHFKIIPTYVTRALRRQETEKIHISKIEFEKLSKSNQFLYLKEHFNEFYGIKRSDMELACSGAYVWMIDFPIDKVKNIKDCDYKLVIILPSNEFQISDNLIRENRIDRIDAAIEDYNRNYADLSLENFKSNPLVLKNEFINFNENIKSIIHFLKC